MMYFIVGAIGCCMGFVIGVLVAGIDDAITQDEFNDYDNGGV